MTPKKPGHKRPTHRRSSAPKSRLTYTGGILSPAYPPPPTSVAGKWVAWTQDRQIVTSGDTLSEVAKAVESLGAKGVTYGHVPRSRRFEAR